MKRSYLIALGSNQRHVRHGGPRAVLRAALAVLMPEAASPIIATAPLGPSRRRYANAAAIIRSHDKPDALLARLKAIEASFGCRRAGQPWRARVLDLDIIMWQGGAWSSPGLTVPHVAFRSRSFVITPAAQIAPRWRDPLTGLTVRQLQARLTRRLTNRGPIPKRGPW